MAAALAQLPAFPPVRQRPRPRVARREVDLLRAVLTNCARHGPSTQDREEHPAFEAHLRGRVSWVAQHDPARGARLQRLLDAVDWD
ncbi:hypothetical protein QUS89_22955, partial [Xanthomonas citri pv. citri]